MKTIIKIYSILTISFFSLFTHTDNLWAHHFEGKMFPSTPLKAFVSGIAHPVLELDHVFFFLLAFFLSYLMGTFSSTAYLIVLGTLCGGIISYLAHFTAITELLLAQTIIFLGLFLLAKNRLSIIVANTALITFSSIHGFFLAVPMWESSMFNFLLYQLGSILSLLLIGKTVVTMLHYLKINSIPAVPKLVGVLGVIIGFCLML